MIGQRKAVSLIEKSFGQSAAAHAYLLVGPRHVGKMTFAITMAQALNCSSATPPCGECPACQRIAGRNFSDVQVVGLQKAGGDETRPKTEISIEQVRELQHTASLAPFEGRCRVFILDQAELLSREAANALLKTIEEPPAGVVFILLTANEEALLPTVVSRCQRLELRPLPAGEVEQALLAKEIEPDRAKLLGRLARGLVGWALDAASDESLVSDSLTLRDRLIGVVRDGLMARLDYAAELAGIFGRDRQKASEILEIWRDWWRDLMLAKLGISESIINVDRLAEINEMASGMKLENIRKFIGDIERAEAELRQNASPRLVLEVLALNIPEVKNG
ncbi:MAG: AAA family ATPase [Dehalococcoidales bacterium]|nr:AAA family ATPase [Dehalococcoidales bacterium]